MAEHDFFADDEKAREAYHTKPFDIEGARAKAAKWLDKIGEQISSGATRGKRNWSHSNNSFHIQLPFAHNGVDAVHRAGDKVADYLKSFKEAIVGGKFDDSIRAHHESTDTTATPVKTTRKPREGGGGKGWSEERRARFAASIAARNAEKN